jgi:hypothetical protein
MSDMFVFCLQVLVKSKAVQVKDDFPINYAKNRGHGKEATAAEY